MGTLANLIKIEVDDIIRELPNVQVLDVAHYSADKPDDLFLSALGFEGRCSWIPELLAEQGKYRAIQAVYFEYATNQADNDLSRPRLVGAMETFASQVRRMPCDSDDLAYQLRTLMREVTAKSDTSKVTFDISVCSSRLVVTSLTVLLEFKANLRIVYSEASLYHPTKEEYQADPDKWTKDEGLGIARGVSAVTRSPDHPGSRRDILPEAVIAFPTFKPERTRAIIADIDPSLLLRPEERVVWVIGKPHLHEDHWRADIQRDINLISPSAPAHEVSTFDYKEALEILERVYRDLDCKYHVTIATLGSKMQSIGVVLFWYIRPEVSVVFATPKEYNATQYSEGCKAVWYIDFGDLTAVRKLLDTVGVLRVRNG